MKALVYRGPGAIEWADVALPEIHDSHGGRFGSRPISISVMGRTTHSALVLGGSVYLSGVAHSGYPARCAPGRALLASWGPEGGAP